jgi:hypothetical protein
MCSSLSGRSPGAPTASRPSGWPSQPPLAGWDTAGSPNRSGCPPQRSEAGCVGRGANSEIITSRATIFRSDLDHATPEQHPRFDTPLANMVHMVGAAAGAWLRRFGIAPPAPGLTGTPQQIASIIASGWLLAATVTASARFWRPG